MRNKIKFLQEETQLFYKLKVDHKIIEFHMEKKFHKILKLLKVCNIIIEEPPKTKTGKRVDYLYQPLRNGMAEIYYSVGVWDFFSGEDKNDCVNFILHELGHWIVASKQSRRRRDYGISNQIATNKSDLDEMKARVIQNYLLTDFGFNDSTNYFRGLVSIFSREKLKNNQNKLKLWWESEGKILAKTYADLV